MGWKKFGTHNTWTLPQACARFAEIFTFLTWTCKNWEFRRHRKWSLNRQFQCKSMKNYWAQTLQNLAFTKILQKFRKTSTPQGFVVLLFSPLMRFASVVFAVIMCPARCGLITATSWWVASRGEEASRHTSRVHTRSSQVHTHANTNTRTHTSQVHTSMHAHTLLASTHEVIWDTNTGTHLRPIHTHTHTHARTQYAHSHRP